MAKITFSQSIAGALFSLCLATMPAEALSSVTFVSGKGTDTGTCAVEKTPCRTFSFALGQTSAGGEIKALDPADYRSVTITQSISITGVEGAGIDATTGDAIDINAGASDTINLSRLTIDGLKQAANNGILLNSGGSLTIAHCTFRNFGFDGIQLQPSTNLSFLIADTLVSDNGIVGIVVHPIGSAQGTLDHVSMKNNSGLGTGMSVSQAGTGVASVTVVDSVATNNSIGFDVSSGGVLRLALSAATLNITGVRQTTPSTAESAGNNFIRGNGTDIQGTLTKVGTK